MSALVWMVRLWVLWALCVVAAPALAARDDPGFLPIRDGKAVTLRSDRAYILMRFTKPAFAGTASAIFLREPSSNELNAYEEAKRAAHRKTGTKVPYDQFAFAYAGASNLFEATPKKPFSKSPSQTAVLIDAAPGSYVLYGQGFNGFLWTCFCLGTVAFDVLPGVVTDIGTIFLDQAWKPSPFPDLASEAGLGPTGMMDYGLWAGALRPVGGSDSVPAALASLPRQPAHFRAIGPWVDPNSLLVHKLAAIPGVLRYDDGRVIDVATGAEKKPR